MQTAKTNPIRVLLAEDHTVVRQGLRFILDTAPEIEVVGEAENGRQAVNLAKTLRPDVALLDVAMPHLNGIEAAKQLRGSVPGIRILVLSSYDDDRFVYAALSSGVAGYLHKRTAASDLIRAIREVSRGKTFFSPHIAKRLGAGDNARLAVARRADSLSNRESEVLQLIAEGFANKQIADELKISVKTVEKHRQSMMGKLNIHEIAGLTRYAIERGLVEQPLRIDGSAFVP
ncbi:MAG: response regulator transcription factor [Verrucomicrobia subdivision 3 bacterium]|nr:response regulator transcription factor [Limisphaerales bacterium]